MTNSTITPAKTLTNKAFELIADDPVFNPRQQKPKENFTITCTSLVKEKGGSLEVFIQQIIDEIQTLRDDCLLFVMPEYAFRDANPQEVIEGITKKIAPVTPKDLTVVFGTIEFTLNGSYTNNAIIYHNNSIWYRPKTKILGSEQDRGLQPGFNKGVIKLPFFNLGIAVCADLWDNKCIKKLICQEADIIAVPAWTGTSNQKFALKKWQSLVSTESEGKTVVIAVSDHFKAPPDSKFQVAGATQIISPNDWNAVSYSEPLYKSVCEINLEQVKKVRENWKKKGLAQSYLFKSPQPTEQVTDVSVNMNKPAPC